MIDIKNFHSNLLKIDKKSYEDICTIQVTLQLKSLVIVKMFLAWINLYLIINSATGCFEEKSGEKYLILDSSENYKELFSGIISEIKTIKGGKELHYEKKYTRNGINTKDDLPLKKQLKFPTLTIIIRCLLQKYEKLYPQIYLDECLYEFCMEFYDFVLYIYMKNE